jgi:light-regulated signal transduction histidine kinase (bacteriophytochrome)
MQIMDDMCAEAIADPRQDQNSCIQSAGWLLEVSLDWIVLRASENIHHLLGESHVTLIDEPLGRFVHAQALHDLRNLFSRLSATTGIARAYAVRLTDDPDLVDLAFQQSDARILLEAVPSAGTFGEAFGSVGGLVDGLSHDGRQALLDGGARRMRALTGYDRVTLVCGDERAESCRGGFAAPARIGQLLTCLIADTEAPLVNVFPRITEESSVEAGLLCAPPPDALEALRAAGIRSALHVPFGGERVNGRFQCESRTPHKPSLELHAAAELFAQLFAMRLEIDQLRRR